MGKFSLLAAVRYDDRFEMEKLHRFEMLKSTDGSDLKIIQLHTCEVQERKKELPYSIQLKLVRICCGDKCGICCCSGKQALV